MGMSSAQLADKLNRITAGTAGTVMAMATVDACGIADAAASSGDAGEEVACCGLQQEERSSWADFIRGWGFS